MANNSNVAHRSYTREEVNKILVALQVGCNENHGLKDLPGVTYGDRADLIISKYDKAVLEHPKKVIMELAVNLFDK